MTDPVDQSGIRPTNMLAKRIIPCLDVDGGRVVKGVSFVNLRDAGDPAEMAELYDQEGGDELVFLDISASVESRKTMINVVREVSNRVFIPLTVGGGIRTVDDIRNLLRAGADKVSINTTAVQDPSLVQEASFVFGNQCIVVAIDARKVAVDGDRVASDPISLDAASRWEVYTHGGRIATGIDVVKWAKKMVSLGAGEILLTSMDADGRKEGYDLELTRSVAKSVSVPLIASGGAGDLGHLKEALTVGEADAVLAASIFHYGLYSINQAKEYLANERISVRR